MNRAALYMWTIYDSPRDFPGRFVAREWRATAAGRCEVGPLVASEATIDGCRAALDRYLRVNHRIRLSFLYRFDRQDGDEPQIVETWI